MSLQKKLDREYRRGLFDGYKDTWAFFVQAMGEIKGIGKNRIKVVQDRVAELAKERFEREREDGR
ncbi:hypothetical protein [Brevibacillus massiliensis]|uniref:hypothetical protein n=1 Tax=Brevibacillus massiliensis TaxID=1118054 RepID=UPI0002E79921|nr:hypothetical protein [Brevibacillus massiliensis]